MDQFNLESFFMKFFYKVAKAENASNSTSINTDCLRKVKEAFHKKTFKAGDSDIRFDFPEIRCAYLFQYTTLFSSAVASHFMDMLWKNRIILDRLLTQDSVVVCCLGGGPTTEVVAIAKILDEMMSVYHVSGQRLKEMKIFAIDIDSDWSITAENAVKNMSDSLSLQFSLIFIQSDLAEPLTEEVQNALEKADIVTTVKFISVIYSTKGRHKTAKMLQRIVNFMSDGALLFFLDSSVSKYYNIFKNTISSFRCMREIYGQNSVHKLSPFTRTECHKLYCRTYKEHCFAFQTKNYVSSWCKEDYRPPSFQMSVASTDQLTMNVATNLWNGPRFEFQPLSQNDGIRAPYYRSLDLYLTTERKKRAERKSRLIRYFKNYKWNARSEKDSAPPRKKRRYF